LAACALIAQCALAAEADPEADRPAPGALPGAPSTVQKTVSGALDLVGIRYRRGGESAEAGFDCSGFVYYVFREGLGIELPRTTREISREGEPVRKAELAAGDLVFFNTLRRAFSHVGIYLGDHRFVHAPRPGASVRVEDLREGYWARRYNGARRVGGRQGN
jgi:cell wall-associated NlpC family hydrolase